MNLRWTIALIGLSAISLGPAPEAATLWVPDDQPTIQAGLNAASPGDTVSVRCGTYFEHDIVLRHGVALRSEAGDPGCVTIDAQALGCVLSCPGFAEIGPDAPIIGLTLMRGVIGLRGGLCEDFSPLVINCVFLYNINYAASFARGSRPEFTHCVFSETAGPAIRMIGPSISLYNCTFYYNAGRPASALVMSTPSFEFSSAFFSNCIIAFGLQGPPISCAEWSSVVLSCCDVFGNEFGDWVGCISGQGALRGNIALDPLFCDAAHQDFRISTLSPCALAPSCGLIGARSVGCGPQAIEPMTWGRVKARFR